MEKVCKHVSFRWESLLFGGLTVIKALQIRGSSKCGVWEKNLKNQKACLTVKPYVYVYIHVITHKIVIASYFFVN